MPAADEGAVRAAAAPSEPESRRPAARHRDAPRDAIEWQLTILWQRLLERGAVGLRDDFFALGGTRALAEEMLAEIARTLGVVLPYETLAASPRVAAVAAALRGREDCHVRDSLLPIRTRGVRAPFFLLHRARGHLLPYQQLVQHLSSDLPLYGLQAVERAPDMPLHTTIEEMAEHQIAVMRRVQPSGPYRFGGSSFGGVLAFEIARRLEQQGERVSLLALLDTDPPPPPLGPIGRSMRAGRRMRRYALHHWREIRALPGGRRVGYSGALAARVLRRALRLEAASAGSRDALPQPLFDCRTMRMLYAAFYAHRPGRYGGRVTLFAAQQHRLPGLNLPRMWRPYARDLEVVQVPGGHLTMLTAPHVEHLARALGDALDRADARAGSLHA